MQQKRSYSKLLTDQIDPTKLYEWGKIKETVDRYQRKMQRFRSVTQQKPVIGLSPPKGGAQLKQRACKCHNHIQHQVDLVRELSQKLTTLSITPEEYVKMTQLIDPEQIQMLIRGLPREVFSKLNTTLSDLLPQDIVEERLNPITEEQEQPRSERLRFYLSALRPKFCGLTLDELLESWAGDLQKLESDKSYFQFLFPAFSGRDAVEDARTFRMSHEIAERIFRAYAMMLQFYGLQLVDRQSGKVARAANYQERYRQAFLLSFNQAAYRIKKILQFLNITGFRKYAVQLVQFLHYEIFGVNGKHATSSNGVVVMRSPPLSKISQIFAEWENFGELSDAKRQTQFLRDHCLLEYEELQKNSEFFHDSIATKLLFPNREPNPPIAEEPEKKEPKTHRTQVSTASQKSKTARTAKQ